MAKEESVLRACRLILSGGTIRCSRRVDCNFPVYTKRRGRESPLSTKLSVKSGCDHEATEADAKLKYARPVSGDEDPRDLRSSSSELSLKSPTSKVHDWQQRPLLVSAHRMRRARK